MANNFFGLTDTGRVRGNNEDTFILQPSGGGEYILACAIDGVGGYSGGEIAASLARESIIEYFKRSGSDITAMMIEALRSANEKIYNEKIEVKEHDSMACVLTLAVVDIPNNEFHYIHVGDTRLYLLRDSSLVKLTKDQSFVGYLEDSGRLSEEAAMSHPKRNEINKALGFNTGLENDVDYFETGKSPFLPGDIILLCSDGLTDMVNKQDITDILNSDRTLEEMAQKLVDTANSKGGKDNITAVLVKNDKPFQQQETVKRSAVSKKKALAEEEPGPEKVTEPSIVLPALPSGRRNRMATVLLSLLSLGLLSTTIYFFLQRAKPEIAEEHVAVAHRVRTESETNFSRDLMAFTGDTLVLHDSIYTQPIVISESIKLDRDSLYILARGKIVFKSDSMFRGPAFLVNRGKSIVFNGMVFDGFDVGIASKTKYLQMVGVRFFNCGVPVQFQFSPPTDSIMNGTLREIFLRDDSLALPIQK